jgi:hypothetical protein
VIFHDEHRQAVLELRRRMAGEIERTLRRRGRRLPAFRRLRLQARRSKAERDGCRRENRED